MSERPNSNTNNQKEGRSGFSRRTYLHGLVGGGALAGLGVPATVGQVAGADDELARTLTIEAPSNESSSYTIGVDGHLAKSTAMGASINSGDTVDTYDQTAGQTAIGTVGYGGRDSYSITGSLTQLSVDGGYYLYVNGEEVNNIAQIEGTSGTSVSYEMYVDGEVLSNPTGSGSTEANDIVSGRTAGDGLADSTRPDDAIPGETVISGVVGGGEDAYLYSGDVHGFNTDGNVTVSINKETVDPETLQRDILTVQSNGGLTEYELTVSGALVKSERMGATIDSDDTISGNTATGAVNARDADSYAFTGEITDFSIATGNPVVYINGNWVQDEDSIGGTLEPLVTDLPNNVTIHNTSNGREDYELSVSGNIAAGEQFNWKDGEHVANGLARGYLNPTGTDSLAFSGEITTLTDYNTFQMNIQRDGQTLTVEDFDKDGGTEYEIVVSGDITRTEEGVHYPADSTSGGTATGEVFGGVDYYDFTGELLSVSINDSLDLDIDFSERPLIERELDDLKTKVGDSNQFEIIDTAAQEDDFFGEVASSVGKSVLYDNDNYGHNLSFPVSNEGSVSAQVDGYAFSPTDADDLEVELTIKTENGLRIGRIFTNKKVANETEKGYVL